MDDVTRRAFDAEVRLRGRAADILEHQGCEGCRVNAAQTLEFLGTFEDMRQRLGIEDPREAQGRRVAELRAQAVAGRPPHLRLGLDADVVVSDPSQDVQDQIASVVREALEQAIRNVRGATLASIMAIRIDA